MPTRTDAPTGAPVWILLQTTDEPAARRFYGRSSAGRGRPRIPMPAGTSPSPSVTDRVAGCSEHDPIHPQADTWMTYFKTSDARATTAGGDASRARPCSSSRR